MIRLTALLVMIMWGSIVTGIRAEEGPHGGELFANGSHTIHAEFVHERSKDTVTVYVLDSKAKEEVAVPAKHVSIVIKGKDKVIQLPAVNAKDGKASRFELKDALFGEKVDTATLKLSVVLAEGKSEESFHFEKD